MLSSTPAMLVTTAAIMSKQFETYLSTMWIICHNFLIYLKKKILGTSLKLSPDADKKKYKDETLQTRSSHMFKLVLFKFVTRCVSHLMEFDRHFYSYEKKESVWE